MPMGKSIPLKNANGAMAATATAQRHGVCSAIE
jgi:hypothetical protein